MENIPQLTSKLDVIYKLSDIFQKQMNVFETSNTSDALVDPVFSAVNYAPANWDSCVSFCNTRYRSYLIDKNVEILDLLTDKINIEIIFNNSVTVSDVYGGCIMQNVVQLNINRRSHVTQLLIEKNIIT